MTLTPSEVASLTRSLSRWEIAEYFASGLVTLACAGEYIASFKSWFTGGDKDKKERLSKRSTLLLIASLSFELVCLVQTNLISGRLLGSLDDKADSASKKSEQAIINADSALTKSGDAKTLATQAEFGAGKANAVAHSASLQVAALDKVAGDAEKRALDGAERVVKLEQQLEWRRLSPQQVADICKAVSLFAGTDLEIDNIMGDAEGQQYATDFSGAIQSKECGWTVANTGGARSVVGVLPEGVWVSVRDPTNRAATALLMALMAADVRPNHSLEPTMNPGRIKLFIGIRPRPKNKDIHK